MFCLYEPQIRLTFKYFFTEMLKSALGAWDKETKIEIMCWKVMKSGQVNF